MPRRALRYAKSDHRSLSGPPAAPPVPPASKFSIGPRLVERLAGISFFRKHRFQPSDKRGQKYPTLVSISLLDDRIFHSRTSPSRQAAVHNPSNSSASVLYSIVLPLLDLHITVRPS